MNQDARIPAALGVAAAVGLDGAFESLLAPVLSMAFRVALSLTRNAADAEDLVQEASLLAFKGFGQFQPGTNFKAWFLRILTNAFFGRCRKSRRSPQTVPLVDAAGVEFAPVGPALHAGPEQDPAAIVSSRVTTDRVLKSIRALPPEFRSVATLYFVDELSYQEMAEILDCPAGTVRSRLHRARRMLRSALLQTAWDHGVVPRTLAAATARPTTRPERRARVAAKASAS